MGRRSLAATSGGAKREAELDAGDEHVRQALFPIGVVGVGAEVEAAGGKVAVPVENARIVIEGLSKIGF